MIENFKLIYPSKDILNKFTSIVSPMERKVIALKKENQLLEETRDLLIHKLIK